MKTIPMALAAITACILVSCKDDPELIAKREQQRAEINKLEGELSLLGEKLKNAPTDRRQELIQTQTKAQQLEKQVAELEGDIATLETRKKTLEDELRDYQREYPLR